MSSSEELSTDSDLKVFENLTLRESCVCCMHEQIQMCLVVGWLRGGVAGGLVGWLGGWLMGRLVDWWVGWLAGRAGG